MSSPSPSPSPTPPPILPYPKYSNDSHRYIDLHTNGNNAIVAQGAFGEVSLALDTNDSSTLQYVAIKTVRNAFAITSANASDGLASSWGFADTSSSSSSTSSPKYQLTKEVFCEITALRLLTNNNTNNPHITPLLSVYPTKQKSSFYNAFPSTSISLVFPYCPASLHDILQSRKYSTHHHFIPWVYLKQIFQDMISALHYCHSCGILHRDIKPGNFLINKQGFIQLTDFGLAKAIPSSATPSSKLESHVRDMTHNHDHDHDHEQEHALGTIHYLSPELLYGSKLHYKPSLDIFALALVWMECISLQTVICGKNTMDQLSKMVQLLGTPGTKDIWPDAHSLPDYNKIEFPLYTPKELEWIVPRLMEDRGSVMGRLHPSSTFDDGTLTSMLLQMLQLDPLKRPSAKDCVSHSWFHSPSNPHLKDKTVFRKIMVQELVDPQWLEPTTPWSNQSYTPEDLIEIQENAIKMVKTRRKMIATWDGEWGNGYLRNTATTDIMGHSKQDPDEGAQTASIGCKLRSGGLLDLLSTMDR